MIRITSSGKENKGISQVYGGGSGQDEVRQD